MTRNETIQVLSLLKAAYPASYRGLTVKEANGVISVWQTQFYDMPVDIVLLAINKLITTLKFPPSVAEVKEKMIEIGNEAKAHLLIDKGLHNLTDHDRDQFKRIEILTRIAYQADIPITELMYLDGWNGRRTALPEGGEPDVEATQ